jgi:hypothetical protein
MFLSSCARRFPPKIIITRIERGETIKGRRECGEGLFRFLSLVFGQGGQIGAGLWKGLKRRVVERREKGVETSRLQRGWGWRKSKPRRRGADLRIPDGRFVKNQTPECGVKFHARILSSTVGPRKIQVSRDVDRPVTIKARVIEFFFKFSRSQRVVSGRTVFFCSDSSYRSAGDLACKRPVRPITVFFCKSSCLFYFIIFCVLVRRATSFSILNLAFFLWNEVRPEGTVPPIVGGVEE